jgi:putative tricarboxylic transport membrane protein
MRINDAVIGIMVIGISIILILHARTFPALPGIPYGPGFFPNIILGTMIAAGVVLVFKGAVRWKETGWISIEPWAKDPRSYLTLGAIGAAHLFYYFFSEWLGFIFTSILLILFLLLLTRGVKKLVSSAIISITFSSLIYYVFGMILRVPLPPGLMRGLL